MDAFAKQQFTGQTMMSLRMLFNRNKAKAEEDAIAKSSMQLTKELPNGDKVTEIHHSSRNNNSSAFFSHGSSGGGNFIPGAAGVGIIETSLTKAMDEEGMLGPHD